MVAYAYAQRAQCLVLTEPYAFIAGNGDTIIRRHTGYSAHLPLAEGAPRLVVYTRIDLDWRRPSNQLLHTVCVRSGSTTLAGVYCNTTEAFNEVLRLQATNGHTLLVAGDFNAHHKDWDPQANNNRRGIRLAQWAQREGLKPTLVGLPTQDRGYCIDNVFGPPGVGSSSTPPCEVRSDHRLVSFIPHKAIGRPHATPKPIRIAAEKKPEVLRLARHYLAAIPPIQLHTIEAAETTAAAVSQVLQLVGMAVGSRHRNCKAWPWWDAEC